MRTKTITARIQILVDEQAPPDQVDRSAITSYLTEIMELPQEPEAEPGEPYYVVAVTVDDFYEGGFIKGWGDDGG